MDSEFPMLEYLCIGTTIGNHSGLILPKTFQAPHLCRLITIGVVRTVRSPILTTAAGLIMLSLVHIPRSAYFSPNDLILCISLLPQLEALFILFLSHPPQNEIGTRILQTSILTSIILANLRLFAFKGASAYLEELLPRITTPLLEKYQVRFFCQSDVSITFNTS